MPGSACCSTMHNIMSDDIQCVDVYKQVKSIYGVEA